MSRFVDIERSVTVGSARGQLAAGEDLERVLDALCTPQALVDRGAARPLSGGTVVGAADLPRRLVLEVATERGPRIVKLNAPLRPSDVLRGLAGGSAARREHGHHVRAFSLEVAAAAPLGFVELRRGGRLVRSCLVQSVVDAPRLDALLAAELAAHGDAALVPLGRALAHMHHLGFFHADLKPFHAFTADVTTKPGEPASYHLRWIDLGRVAFRLTRRRRIINLYQTLRYCVPPRPAAHARLVQAYAEASGWYAEAPERALQLVHAFLAHKYRTHPG